MLRKLIGLRGVLSTDSLLNWAVVCLIAGGLIGCAALEPTKPEDAVKKLATARLQLLMAGDFAQAYGSLVPSYRAVVPLDRFRADTIGATLWKSVDVIGVQCELVRCTARVRIDSQHPLAAKFGGVLSTHVDEIWLLEGGRWWLFQKL